MTTTKLPYVATALFSIIATVAVVFVISTVSSTLEARYKAGQEDGQAAVLGAMDSQIRANGTVKIYMKGEDGKFSEVTLVVLEPEVEETK